MNTEHQPNAAAVRLPTEEGELPLGGISETTLFLLGRCIERLEDSKVSPAWVVHEVRKDLKRARALLRLAGDDPPAARRLEKRCAVAARKLSHLRDADAMLETLSRLGARADARQRDALAGLADELARARKAGVHGPGLQRAAADDIARSLRDIRRDLASVALERLDAAALERGLAAARANAASKFRRVASQPRMPVFHEFRKAVKRELHQRELSGRPFERMERATLRKLAEVLGELQDLDVLRRALREGRRWRGPVRRLVSQTMRELQARALRLGAGRYPKGKVCIPADGACAW